MKLSLELGSATHRIHAYGEGVITINETEYDQPLVVMPELVITPWSPPAVKDLQSIDFTAIDDHDREILLLGTGRHQHFPDARLIADMAHRGIGLEVMDTAAACRTYNVLMAEERRVAAALFMIEPAG